MTDSSTFLSVGRALGVGLISIGALPGNSPGIVASSSAEMIRVPPTGSPFCTAARAISLRSEPKSALRHVSQVVDVELAP